MEDRLLAVNRSLAEDEGTPLTDQKVSSLFQGLDFTRIDDQAGSSHSMIQEIWRTFLMAMLLAIVLEAFYACLKRPERQASPDEIGQFPDISLDPLVAGRVCRSPCVGRHHLFRGMEKKSIRSRSGTFGAAPSDDHTRRDPITQSTGMGGGVSA